ncbi:MAG: YbaB/EbfC family nucleoid-associated protein [Rhodothalassiaceae bacterium]
MKNLGQMLKQAQQMQQKMAEMQAALEQSEVEGRSGGGLVRIRLSAKGDLRGIAIDKSLLVPDEGEVLEDLIIAAHADAREKAETLMREELAKATGGLKLPDGFQMPF